MDFRQWCHSVDTFLVSRNRGVRIFQLDPGALQTAFQQKMAPIAFATQVKLPLAPPQTPSPTPPPYPPPWVGARARQAAQVLADPRYLLDTGLQMGCPTCGSSNLADIGKAQGTGLMYFGSLAWVLAASVVDHMVAQTLSGHQIQCNYCGASFTL